MQGIPTAPYVHFLKRQFKITHPFHPLFQQEFTLLLYRKSWGRTYVEYVDAQDNVGAVPLEWTDAAPPDSFVAISATRAVFRIQELLRLKQLVDSLKCEKEECK